MTHVSPSNLGSVISNPTWRKLIYGSYVILGFLIGATQVGFAAIPDAGQPVWLTVALAVYAFAGVPVGTLAVSNTPSGASSAG